MQNTSIDYLTRKIAKGVTLNYSEKENIKDVHIVDPLIYFFYDYKNNVLDYVGETMNPQTRFKRHEKYSGQEVITFSSDYFHKSVIYDIETKMIRLLKSYEKTKNIEIQNVKNNQTDFNYFTKELYEGVEEKIWDKLVERCIVDHDYNFVVKTSAFKWSPFIIPNDEQKLISEKIVNKISSSNKSLISLEGDAGTGKTIVAVQVAVRLSSQDIDVKFVTGNEKTKTSLKDVFNDYKNIAVVSYDQLHKWIKEGKMKDSVIIFDEAQSTIQHSKIRHGEAVKKANKRRTKFVNDYLIEEGDSTVQMSLEHFDHILMCFDEKQIVFPDGVNIREIFENNQFAMREVLKDQMRTNKLWSEFVKFLLFKETPKEKIKYSMFKAIFDYGTASDMIKGIKTTGSYALTSGYAFEWKTKNGGKSDFEEIGLNDTKWIPAKSPNFEDWIHTDEAKSLKEVAYYKAIQGFEVDNGGLIIGNDLKIENDTIIANVDFLRSLKGNAAELPVLPINENDPDDLNRFNEKLNTITLNRYYVLLTRFRHSIDVFIENKSVREFFNKKWKEFNNLFVE